MDAQVSQRLESIIGRLAADPATAELAAELRQLASDIDAHWEKISQEAKRGAEQLAIAGRLIEMGTMAAAVFHEMNQPLLGIKGFAELLQEAIGDDQNEKMTGWAQEIRKQVDRIQQMQRQVAGFLRPDTSSETRAQLGAAVEEALVLFRTRMAKRKIELVERLPDGLPPVAIAPQHLVQIFANLFGNAVDALGDQPERTLWLEADRQADGSVRTVVADSGPGVAAEIGAHLFEPFHTTKGENGSGLGLYISRWLAEHHGGRLRLVDPHALGWRPAPATAFELVLPPAAEAEEA